MVQRHAQGHRGYTEIHSEVAYADVLDLEKAASPQARSALTADFHKRYLPRYAFNAQRVDLALNRFR